MLEVFDKNRLKMAILQNATNIVERTRRNGISNFEFALPANDPKNEYCQQFNLIRYNKGEYYRILGEVIEESETNYITYRCEHVLALLMDSLIPEFIQIGGLGYFTRQVIEYILSFQKVRHWVLRDCDFSRQFEYGLDKENVLSALFSVPNRFTDAYEWVTNTKVYPYEISLKAFDTNRNPDFIIRKGQNRLKLSKKTDSTYLCTRLYAYGAGEGINQLDISDLNNGKKYLQSPQSFIDKYGLIEKAWVDRRYTVQQSLLESAQVMLNELQEPYYEYETQVLEDVKVGNIIDIKDFMKTYVVETETYYQEIPVRYIKIANKPQDIASSVADLADRQRIEMTYSQGATQVYAAQGSENADANTPFNISLYIPTEMIYINSVYMKIRLGSFRAYNTNIISGGAVRTSSDGGSTVRTTSDGGATTSSSGGATTTSSGGGQTTSSGGGTSTSTGGGGGTSTSSGSGGQQTSGASSVTTTDTTQVTAGSIQIEDDGTNIGKHNHGMSTGLVMMVHNGNWKANLTTGVVTGGETRQFTASGAHNHGYHSHYMMHTHTVSAHTHTVSLYDHTHSITVSAHQHSVYDHTHSVGSHTHTVGNHNHSVTIGTHTHTVDTEHTHNITPKISFFGNPSEFSLLVNNVVKANFNGRDAQIDLTDYLVGADRKIPRGQWITIGIKPNDIAHVEVAYNIQGFCQSRGDATV